MSNPLTPTNPDADLSSLQDRNEVLFYKVLLDHLAELAPIVYTPTVGEVCKRFGNFYQRPRGMYFSTADRGLMSSMVYNWDEQDVDIIVLTDGSRILGLGDLGANGMGIPIGKLALYCAAGGLHPRRVLPVMLDAGTDNVTLRGDPWYLGMPHPRVTGDAYFSLVHELVRSLAQRWPRAVLQFEDFSSIHAQDILDTYRHDTLCFNDDISGTGAVCLASVLAAIRVQGPGARLSDQRIVVVGAGSAGMGVAQALFQAMITREGVTPEAARDAFWVVDHAGLLCEGRSGMTPEQAAFARVAPHRGAEEEEGEGGGAAALSLPDGTPLADVVAHARPTILLGLTGRGGTFTQSVIEEMARHCARPIIFPLSNPTSNAECTAEQVRGRKRGGREGWVLRALLGLLRMLATPLPSSPSCPTPPLRRPSCGPRAPRWLRQGRPPPPSRCLGALLCAYRR